MMGQMLVCVFRMHPSKIEAMTLWGYGEINQKL